MGLSAGLVAATCPAYVVGDGTPVKHHIATSDPCLPADVLVFGEEEEALVQSACVIEEAPLDQHRRTVHVVDIERSVMGRGRRGEGVLRREVRRAAEEWHAQSHATWDGGEPAGTTREASGGIAQQGGRDDCGRATGERLVKTGQSGLTDERIGIEEKDGLVPSRG